MNVGESAREPDWSLPKVNVTEGKKKNGGKERRLFYITKQELNNSQTQFGFCFLL